MSEDRSNKCMEFKEGLKTYKEYLEKLNREAKKKLEGKVGFFHKLKINGQIKKRQEKLKILSEILEIDDMAHLSCETIAYENASVIEMLRSLPALENRAAWNIAAAYVSEESDLFCNEKPLINEARITERNLLAKLSSKIDDDEFENGMYKDLSKLFEESLGDLQVFDLKLGVDHKEVSFEQVEDAVSSKLALLDDYRNCVQAGKLSEISGLALKDIDITKQIIILDAKNRLRLEMLKKLLELMPDKNEKEKRDKNTCKLIRETIEHYQGKINVTSQNLNIDFAALKAKVDGVKMFEKQASEETLQEPTPYSLEEIAEFKKQLAMCSFTKIERIYNNMDTSSIDEEITQMLNGGLGKSLSDTDIYNTRKKGALRYAELQKIPFNEEVFNASLAGIQEKKI